MKENELNQSEYNKYFDESFKSGKIKWQKKRNKMTHLTPKKKKRK